MRLLECQDDGSFRLTEDFIGDRAIPPYAILSHTWSQEDKDEVSYNDMQQGTASHKPSYAKIQFSGKQALRDGLRFVWVDTCCIDRPNHSELTEAINSMFNWYKNSAKCYVYLSDVVSEGDRHGHISSPPLWDWAFRNSRWFTRGWTLQELLAPSSVEFFTSDQQCLGDRTSLAPKIHEITGIPLGALNGASYLDFSVDERLEWCRGRMTRRPEDIAYCMLGLFNVHMSLIYGEGKDNAFRRLQEEVNWRQRISNGPSKPSHPAFAPSRALWTVPFGRNKNFVGREPILSRLLDVVSPDADVDDCQRTVLEGLGGIGKTHIALELAHRLREHQPKCSVFWVPAVDAASFENGYRQIATKCQLTEESREEEDGPECVMSLVKDALSQEKWGPWLMIIDNADNTDLVLGVSGLAHHLPFSRKGSILLTTRNHEVTTGLDVPLELIFPVDGLDDNDAAALLGTKLLPRQTKDPTSVQELLALLANLPLAIRQASSYMATTGMTVTKYLAHCQSSPRSFIKLLSKDFEDRYRYKATRNPVATTWLMSFNLLMKEKPLAAKYLRFMCLLSAQEIPMYLLPIAEDELDAEEAIGALKGHAFIDERMDSALFSMHRLVRLATQNWIKTEGDWDACVDEVTNRLIETCPSSQHISSAIWSDYLPHALAALELQGGTRNSTSLLSLTCGVAEGNEIIGKYAMAEQMHHKTLAMRLDTLGEAHPDTLANSNALARTFMKNGKLQDASQLYRKTLTVAKQSLSPMHSITLHTLNEFAVVLQRQGEYKEAENLHRATFSHLTVTLGANHPSTLDSKRNIAYTLRKQGRYREAEALQREVLASTEAVFGTHHPETMQNLNNLASTLLSQGHAEEAESMYRSVMLALVDELGDAHPMTLKSKSNLARTLTSLGKYSQAETMHREALEAMTLVLGTQHPHTLQGMSKLGVSLWRQEKFAEAEGMHREALEIYSSTLGPGHPDTVRALDNLLVTLQSQKKAAEVTRLRSEWEERRRVADREGL
ncbi:kinesin light chain 1 [Astrocystis sublimbata]|nr:kinesin light chain 1 [Astrocystis sublimbata]